MAFTTFLYRSTSVRGLFVFIAFVPLPFFLAAFPIFSLSRKSFFFFWGNRLFSVFPISSLPSTIFASFFPFSFFPSSFLTIFFYFPLNLSNHSTVFFHFSYFLSTFYPCLPSHFSMCPFPLIFLCFSCFLGTFTSVSFVLYLSFLLLLFFPFSIPISTPLQSSSSFHSCLFSSTFLQFTILLYRLYVKSHVLCVNNHTEALLTRASHLLSITLTFRSIYLREIQCHETL